MENIFLSLFIWEEKCFKKYTWNVHYWLIQDGRIMELGDSKIDSFWFSFFGLSLYQ